MPDPVGVARGPLGLAAAVFQRLAAGMVQDGELGFLRAELDRGLDRQPDEPDPHDGGEPDQREVEHPLKLGRVFGEAVAPLARVTFADRQEPVAVRGDALDRATRLHPAHFGHHVVEGELEPVDRARSGLQPRPVALEQRLDDVAGGGDHVGADEKAGARLLAVDHHRADLARMPRQRLAKDHRVEPRAGQVDDRLELGSADLHAGGHRGGAERDGHRPVQDLVH